MSEQVRILRVARELDAFTLAELARHAEAKPGTVRSLFTRRRALFHQTERISTKKRGGQPSRFTIDREGALVEIRSLLKDDALRFVTRPFESAYQILLWTLPGSRREERSAALLSAKLVVAQAPDVHANEHHQALRALIALAEAEDRNQLHLEEVDRVRAAITAALDALRSAEYHALANALGQRFQQSVIFERLIAECRRLREATPQLAEATNAVETPPMLHTVSGAPRSLPRPQAALSMRGTVVDRIEQAMRNRLQHGPSEQETAWHH